VSARAAKPRKAQRDETQEAVRRARRAVGGGALLLLAGLGTVGAGPSDAGMALTLLALVVLIYGIHSFGRLGPDARPGEPAR
jgi:hypothetical protein